MPNTNTNQGNQPFAESFEKAIMQFVILEKAKQGEVTKDNLQGVFRGNLQMSGNHLDQCLSTLTQTGHLRQNGNRYGITDDGREDVEKVEMLVIELPQYVPNAQGGQQQRQGVPAQQRGGMTGGGSSGSNVGGSQGNVGGGSNPGQSKGGQGRY